MANAWITHMKPYIADERKASKSSGRKFSLKNAIKAAKKTYKKSDGAKSHRKTRRRHH